MPGLAIFDELAAKYERLLAAQTVIDQQGRSASPARVQRLQQALQGILSVQDLPEEVRRLVTAAIKAE